MLCAISQPLTHVYKTNNYHLSIEVFLPIFAQIYNLFHCLQNEHLLFGEVFFVPEISYSSLFKKDDTN